ncbi:hypothetical protein ACFOSV_04300 [Algoriphagus namhaensis]|uniref:Acetoacetate decarboxylase n=1 Tax=Algoriphagus namhaensis TaxID=915353 RepID=A0ABV8AN76_9BACT
MLKENFIPVAAPWTLKGTGIILIYKLSRDWVEKQGQLPDYLSGKFKGGLGYLMLVNYTESPVGPYQELLFIPGKFDPSGKQSISKIYVSSYASTFNGRANWGIPKDTLPFSWQKENGVEKIKMSSHDQVVFDCQIESGGIPFPVSTALLPIDLYQRWEGQDFFTKPSGKGWGKLAKVKIKTCNPDYFPGIDQIKPLLAVKVDPFYITFPKPSHDL